MRLLKNILILAVYAAFSGQVAFADAMESKMKSESEKVLKMLMNASNMATIKSAISESMAHHGEKSRASKKTPKKISKMDKEWRKWSKKVKKDSAAKGSDWIEKIASNSCTSALKKLQSEQKLIGEIFVMDSVGATACYSSPTSDYDQGDEDKWQVPFVEGKKVHQGELEKDQSTGVALIQFSYPIMDGGKKIGAVTIGITNK